MPEPNPYLPPADHPAAVIFESLGADLPLQRYAELRQHALIRGEPMGWVTARHDVASSVLRDPRFSSNPRHLCNFEDVKDFVQFGDAEDVILVMDPPDHTRLRRLVAPSFTPGALARLEPWIRRRADQLLDAVGGDTFDLVSCFAEPLPIGVIAELLGVDNDPRFSGWGRDLIAGTMDPGLADELVQARSGAANVELAAFLEDLIERRRHEPGDDVLAHLVRAEEAGDRLSTNELVVLCMTLLVAGFVTTVNLIGNAVLTLIGHPEETARLRHDPSLLATAVDEVLRFDGGVVATSRIATQDVQLGGCRIERGEPVNVLVAAANRDPAVFDDPDRFDVGRDNAARHLTFGGGIHHCLGAPLARLEARVALDVLLRRHRSIELAGEPIRRQFGFRGAETLPVRVVPDR